MANGVGQGGEGQEKTYIVRTSNEAGQGAKVVLGIWPILSSDYLTFVGSLLNTTNHTSSPKR